MRRTTLVIGAAILAASLMSVASASAHVVTKITLDCKKGYITYTNFPSGVTTITGQLTDTVYGTTLPSYPITFKINGPAGTNVPFDAVAPDGTTHRKIVASWTADGEYVKVTFENDVPKCGIDTPPPGTTTTVTTPPVTVTTPAVTVTTPAKTVTVTQTTTVAGPVTTVAGPTVTVPGPNTSTSSIVYRNLIKKVKQIVNRWLHPRLHHFCPSGEIWSGGYYNHGHDVFSKCSLKPVHKKGPGVTG